jgi:hypothetical protein
MIRAIETGGETNPQDSQALSSWLADYDRQQSTIGLVNYAERLAQYISRLDFAQSNKIMDGYFYEGKDRRRSWGPDDECTQILVGYSTNCQNSYLVLDDGDPYTEALLIWDCELKQMSIEHPTHDQIWTDPQVRVEGGQWAIYPNAEVCQGGEPDRIVKPL